MVISVYFLCFYSLLFFLLVVQFTSKDYTMSNDYNYLKYWDEPYGRSIKYKIIIKNIFFKRLKYKKLKISVLKNKIIEHVNHTLKCSTKVSLYKASSSMYFGGCLCCSSR